eukprot:1727099-Pyramimonas_sp.AAC.1
MNVQITARLVDVRYRARTAINMQTQGLMSGVPWRGAHKRQPAHTRTSRIFCVVGKPPQNVSYTAKRIAEDSVRVLGDGTDGPSRTYAAAHVGQLSTGSCRIGTSFRLDEFFVAPKTCETDCVIYFPKEDSSSSAEIRPRYGFQLSIVRCTCCSSACGTCVLVRYTRSCRDIMSNNV